LARTRFNTELEAEAWAKCVVSPAPMLNCCQLMMAPLLLVTVRTLPAWLKVAVPFTTVGFTGFDSTGPAIKQAATAATPRRTGVLKRNSALREGFLSLIYKLQGRKRGWRGYRLGFHL
jgi:hypothetical protein